MDNQSLFLNNAQEEQSLTQPNTETVSALAEKLDFLDIQILRKFYTTGKEFPYDTQPYCFPILYKEMKTNHHLKIGLEALRKRLNNLTRLGILVKVRHSNPTSYSPAEGKETLVRGTIVKFFIIHGMTKFL